MFRSLFKKKAPELLPEVAGLTIGRDVSIDPIEMKLLSSDTLFVAPETGFSIVAQGKCDLGEQSFLHRFYLDDDRYILQIQGGDGVADTRIDEIVLWYAYDVQYVSDDGAWTNALRRSKSPRFDLQTEAEPISYDRVWFAHSDADEDLMTYWEDVHDTRVSQDPSRIFQSAMLFGRGLQSGTDEMLLVNLEEPADGERSVSFLIGLALPQHVLIT
ncbi:MAG: DUF2491 family protein [Aliishimia sp.]